MVLPTELGTLELFPALKAHEGPHFDNNDVSRSLSAIQDAYEFCEEWEHAFKMQLASTWDNWLYVPRPRPSWGEKFPFEPMASFYNASHCLRSFRGCISTSTGKL